MERNVSIWIDLVMNATLTPEQAREKMNKEGVTIADWARSHCVDQNITYRVLDGRLKGRSGEAHRVAVLLGIKDGVISVANEKAS